MTTHTDTPGPLPSATGVRNVSAGACAARTGQPPAGSDVVVNAESRSFWDADELVSILSVHTLVCPLIRAELRGEESVRLLIYYHAATRLGLHAYEALLKDGAEVRARAGLRQFVRDTLHLPATDANLHDPGIRELYLHEVIRRLSRPIATCSLASNDAFTVARIV
jgi:hypothetical protein